MSMIISIVAEHKNNEARNMIRASKKGKEVVFD